MESGSIRFFFLVRLLVLLCKRAIYSCQKVGFMLTGRLKLIIKMGYSTQHM